MATENHSIDRRTFLKAAPASVAAAGLTSRAIAAKQSSADPSADSGAETSGVLYRTFGRTGLKVSVIGLGALETSEPAIIRAAFDRGVNWLDTAQAYMNGRNERICGEALKGYRDRVYVTTKTEARSKDEMLRRAEQSLRSLQTDYIDLFLLHGVDDADEVNNGEAREAMAQLRKEGKVRFLGVSTHREVPVVDALVRDPDKFFDAVLLRYSYRSRTRTKEAVARAAKAGLGVIAMKTQAGGYKTEELGDISPHQAALKWVLQDPNVHVAIPGMVDLAQVKENTEVMSMIRLTNVDKQILDRYEKAIARVHCIGCEECTGTCPKGVRIADVNRCLMYAEGYCDMELARSTYTSLPRELTASVCTDCTTCVAKCVNGINIASRMRDARAMFA